MTEEFPYPAYKAACEHWEKVRATPGFEDQAAGRNIKLPPEPSPEEKALALLRGVKSADLAPVVQALEQVLARRSAD